MTPAPGSLVAELAATDVEVRDAVAWVTLNRPDSANSRNQTMREELSTIYAWATESDDVHVLVLTGRGDHFFCAGMDLKEVDEAEGLLERRDRLRSSRDIEQLACLPKPTIAAINGYAVGGGCEMALACDIRIMRSDAQIGLPEATQGLMPGGGGTQRLPRLVGLAHAFELLYSGRLIHGPEAVAMGLVNQQVPGDQLRSATEALAGQLAAQPVTALRAIKESVISGLEVPLSVAIDRELDGLLFLMSKNGSAEP